MHLLGLTLAQVRNCLTIRKTNLCIRLKAVFLGYMVVLKKSPNVGLAAFLIVFTVIVKIMYVTFAGIISASLMYIA